MPIVRNKFSVWSFSLRPELKQCCTSTSCESWPRTPPHEEPFLFQSLVAFILKRRSNTHFEMVNEPLSLAAWRSFEWRDRSLNFVQPSLKIRLEKLLNRIAERKHGQQPIQQDRGQVPSPPVSFSVLYKKTGVSILEPHNKMVIWKKVSSTAQWKRVGNVVSKRRMYRFDSAGPGKLRRSRLLLRNFWA